MENEEFTVSRNESIKLCSLYSNGINTHIIETFWRMMERIAPTGNATQFLLSFRVD